MMPINKRKDGWYWGSKGPFKSKDKAEEVQRAAYASGYQKLEKASITDKDITRLRRLAQQGVKHPEDTVTEEEVRAIEAEAAQTKDRAKNPPHTVKDQFEEEGQEIDPVRAFQYMIKEGDGGGFGTVAVSSDPGVFTETYGERKKKVMNRSNKTASKKNQKSGPEKLDDFLTNSLKSLDDESFLVELVRHVGNELRKAGEGPHGTYTPYNERPYQPPFPQETKRKKRGDEIQEYPTTENTVPVNSGAGSLGQSKIPQESVLAPPGVDDARNMNRPVPRRKKQFSNNPLPTGAYLTPGNESGMNFQAMQKMPTHGNTTANMPKQFSTERPQEPFIERKPRLDPNSDVEQNEFTGNVEAIKDEDKAKKGRPYENNKEGNSFNSKQIDTYSMNMGGHALQALQLSSTNMPVGLDSLKRDSDDAVTEPDEENTKELKRREREEEDIPADKDIVHAEKSAVTKMLDWINDL